MNPVYLVGFGTFLPGNPVSNEKLEEILGVAGGKPSRTRSIVLRNNGIKQRYYAIDPQTGLKTHSNAELAAQAVINSCASADVSLDSLDLLTCGTSLPDAMMPAHANMVQGELKMKALETISVSGVCGAGVGALKHAYLAIKSGDAQCAVSVGSENSSAHARGKYFRAELDLKAEALEKDPALAFESDFLRWMLSDGAGAFILSNQLPKHTPAFRLNWMESISYSGEFEPCMYMGLQKSPGGGLKFWKEFEPLTQALSEGVLNVQQDVKLLQKHVIQVTAARTMQRVQAKRNLTPGDIDWFIPHYSSDYFKKDLFENLKEVGFEIPLEKWFTNLNQVGNIGSASIYVALNEFVHRSLCQPNQNVLCFVPESGRMSGHYFHLTRVQ
jgi:3-oxoacyl-[acyl-carrier-protein] synthase-3